MQPCLVHVYLTWVLLVLVKGALATVLFRWLVGKFIVPLVAHWDPCGVGLTVLPLLQSLFSV